MSDPNPLDMVPEILLFDIPYGPPTSLQRARAVISAVVQRPKAEMENEQCCSRFGRQSCCLPTDGRRDALLQVKIMNRLILINIFTLILTATGIAQTPEQEPTVSELQKQLDEMRSQMAQMQNRIAYLEAARGNAATSSNADPVPLQSQTAPAQALRSQPDETKSLDESTSLHYSGLTLTPGGFLEGTILVRTRNENADIADNYSAIPLNGSSNAKLSEYRGTSRNSQLSLLVQGTAGNTKLKGYVEADFLGAAPTANYVEANAWTPRLRQLWVQLDRPSGWTITIGQTWSLLTTNKHGIATLAELRPHTEDGQYVVGFSWTRQRALRVTKNFNNKVWAAFAVEDPEARTLRRSCLRTLWDSIPVRMPKMELTFSPFWPITARVSRRT